MKQNQLQRIENFIEEKHDGQDNQGIILLESEMETFGSSDPSEDGWTNGGNCINGRFDVCGSNKGACQNAYGFCGGSTNGGDCYNAPKPIPMINSYLGCDQQ